MFHDFPLWSKIWEASLILADYLASRAVEPDKCFLEIGAGLGVVSTVASAFGHHVTATEYDSHALNFIRANSLHNQCSNLEIRELDWNNPRLDGPFDYIVASEVAYHERHFESIQKLLQANLKPDGEAILAAEIKNTTIEFFSRMQQFFNIQAQKKTLRSDDKEIPVILSRMTHK